MLVVCAGLPPCICTVLGVLSVHAFLAILEVRSSGEVGVGGCCHVLVPRRRWSVCSEI
jgi:hypothetical protein